MRAEGEQGDRPPRGADKEGVVAAEHVVCRGPEATPHIVTCLHVQGPCEVYACFK